MPPPKKKGAGLFDSCGLNYNTINDISEPQSPILDVPQITYNSLHAFCVPNFFGNKMPSIPKILKNNKDRTTRVRFF